AAQAVLEETTERPVLIGRPDVIAARVERLGLNFKLDADIPIVNPESDSRYRDYWTEYLAIMERRGVTENLARAIMRTNTTAIGAIMVRRGEADSLICGTFGQYLWHLNYVNQILGTDSLHPVGALSLMISEEGPLFISDGHVNPDPTPQQIADTVISCARHIRRFGLEPKIALCSDSQFGNLSSTSGERMRDALKILDSRRRDFIYEGEMHVDAALDPEVQARVLREGSSRMSGPANALVFASSDAAAAVKNILKARSKALEVGPILMGMGNRAHIVTPAITSRGLLNVAAIAGTPVAQYG
ncbi:MAG: phosphate acyltransferase, partial [Mangrovicoccus sp.]